MKQKTASGEMKMKAYREMTKEELLSLKEELEKQYKEEEAKGLKLNMARGKPGLSQLEIAMPMLDVMNSGSDMHTLLGPTGLAPSRQPRVTRRVAHAVGTSIPWSSWVRMAS